MRTAETANIGVKDHYVVRRLSECGKRPNSVQEAYRLSNLPIDLKHKPGRMEPVSWFHQGSDRARKWWDRAHINPIESGRKSLVNFPYK